MAVPLPSTFYKFILPAWLYQWHSQRQHRELSILHQTLMGIVPKAQRIDSMTQGRPMRLLIDVMDAREMIFSHVPSMPRHAQQEAAYLVELIERGDLIDEGGPYTHSFTDTAMEHVCAVAHYVAVYQRRNQWRSRISGLFLPHGLKRTAPRNIAANK